MRRLRSSHSEDNPGGTIGQNNILHRVVVCLAAPVVFLFTWVFGTRDGSLGAIEEKGSERLAVLGTLIRTRNSSSMRDGASLAVRRTVLSTGMRMFSQVLTFDWIKPKVAP